MRCVGHFSTPRSSPPPGGWARLERERRVVPLPGRRRFRAIAAAAAVLLIGFAAVEVGRRIGRPADTAERELAAAGEASVPEHAFPALRERMIPDSGATSYICQIGRAHV